jgi:hypothetical protein
MDKAEKIDRAEKMDKAERLTKDQQSKRYKKKEDFVLPLEWLHPKQGRHIELIDCLLHHDDLIKGKDTNMSSQSDKTKLIERCLFVESITQWEGTVKDIRSAWKGTITFKERLPVRFVPLNAQPSMPSLGDTVKFCLSFDRFGLSAWQVMRETEIQYSDLFDTAGRYRDDDSSSEHSEQEDVHKEDFFVAPPLCFIRIPEPDEKQTRNDNKGQQPQGEAVSKKLTKWDEQRKQGVVSFANPEMGAGFMENADVEDEPVKDLEGNIVKDVLLDLKVEKLTQPTRAADVRVLKVSKCKILFFRLRWVWEPFFPLRIATLHQWRGSLLCDNPRAICVWSPNWNYLEL